MPTLREIVRLEQAEQTAAAPERSWSPLQGMVFAAGLVIVAASLVAAVYFGVLWIRIPPAVPAAAADDEEFLSHLERASPVDVYEEHWKPIQEHGLGPWQPPRHVIYRDVAIVLRQRVLFALAAAMMGACLAGSSLFLGSRRS